MAINYQQLRNAQSSVIYNSIGQMGLALLLAIVIVASICTRIVSGQHFNKNDEPILNFKAAAIIWGVMLELCGAFGLIGSVKCSVKLLILHLVMLFVVLMSFLAGCAIFGPVYLQSSCVPGQQQQASGSSMFSCQPTREVLIALGCCCGQILFFLYAKCASVKFISLIRATEFSSIVLEQYEPAADEEI